MTHDELQDKIEAIDYWQEHFANRTFLKALRAVVELHKPDKDYAEYCDVCWWEEHERETYPCQTLQVIKKELA